MLKLPFILLISPTNSRRRARSCSNFKMRRSRLLDVAMAAGVATALLSPPASAQDPAPTPSAEDHAGIDEARGSAPPVESARRAQRHARSADARSAASDAILPGFEMLADGSTRLFVELSRPVTYESRAGHGSITYVLKDARVDRRNNQNPLVTVHFNTPVTSARLVPHGRDLWFVIALRSSVRPTVAMDAGKDGGAVMRIEFPKGNYVRAGVAVQQGGNSPSDPGDESSPDRAGSSGR